MAPIAVRLPSSQPDREPGRWPRHTPAHQSSSPTRIPSARLTRCSCQSRPSGRRSLCGPQSDRRVVVPSPPWRRTGCRSERSELLKRAFEAREIGRERLSFMKRRIEREERRFVLPVAQLRGGCRTPAAPSPFSRPRSCSRSCRRGCQADRRLTIGASERIGLSCPLSRTSKSAVVRLCIGRPRFIAHRGLDAHDVNRAPKRLCRLARRCLRPGRSNAGCAQEREGHQELMDGCLHGAFPVCGDLAYPTLANREHSPTWTGEPRPGCGEE